MTELDLVLRLVPPARAVPPRLFRAGRFARTFADADAARVAERFSVSESASRFAVVAEATVERRLGYPSAAAAAALAEARVLRPTWWGMTLGL